MNTKPYHHGDLRAVIIEKGIEFINEHGAKSLSLRKIAAACGVSHSAPYSHFANKDELFSAIQDYITDKFAAALKESVKDTGETLQGLLNMSCAYIAFFAKNTEYFDFLFSRSTITAGGEDAYEPYDFYADFLKKMFENINYPMELRKKGSYAQWAMIHGIAAIGVMSCRDKNPKMIKYWEAQARDMLSNNYVITSQKDF